MRMKPDWLNDSSVTEVEVVAKGSYIRHIMVLQPIARGQVARTSHDTTAVSGEKNESRIRQSVAYRKIDSTMTRNALDNRIYEIEDKFILQHCGGYLQNGFGYQLHKLSNSNVKSVKITGPDASGLSSSIYMEGKETEPGQSHPTILLYDDMTKFKNITDESKKEYTVTITLDGASEKEVVPPYNPFIFISSNEGRGKELHLINYPPTDKADLSLLGTGKDIYRPEEGMYYVSADLMPFAINMPVSNLPVPEEGKRIDQSYPKFSGWVSSNGKQNKDWYK